MGMMLAPILIFFLSLVYAVLRYHEMAFGNHPTDQLPGFIVNKAFSLAAILLIALAIGARSLSHRWGGVFTLVERDRRSLGLTGFAFAVVHALLSMTLLTPDYFEKLYLPGGKMTFLGELSMLTGVLGLGLMIWQAQIPANADSSARRVLRQLGLWVLVLTGVHVLAIGWGGWFKPETWPGYLPPITLWSFLVVVAGLGLGLLRGKRQG